MCEIHVVGDLGDFEVWLDTETLLEDGLVVGLGATREAALTDAIDELERQLVELRRRRDEAKG